MQQISTDALRRRQPETLRRVLAGESFELTTYGAPIGACVVPRKQLDRLRELEVLYSDEFVSGREGSRDAPGA